VERASDGVPRRLQIAPKPSLTRHRGWLPVVFVLIIALFAGWSIMRLNSRSHEEASDVARGGTMLIMLLAALVVITSMRRFDRMRRRLADALHVQATHDPLTGLANRRQLSIDLAAIMAAASDADPARLVVFDLDGFKSYNDSFGRRGGDLLLRRLSGALADVVSSAGTCYRLGGDEFCALFPAATDEAVVQRCVDALGEQGDGFSITSSHGCVLVPTEAADSDLAMQLADERMYQDKDSTALSVGQQTRNLALRMLCAQEPGVELHSAHVAALAAGVARRLGLSDGDCADVVRAAELHDIGKIAIPYAILHKEGPLDADEWEMMRRHTMVGANILNAAPALARVAEFVLCSHERYDGAGYPRRLAGAAIPLASRIIFVCDAFDAMISDRSYQEGMSDDAALDQLRRNAGSQFDPAVVAAFCKENQSTTRAAPARVRLRVAA
jgi:two-component system cell cycle response regulator